MILENNGPQGLTCLHPGPIYMYITIISKHLLWNHLAHQSQILCETSVGKDTNVFINDPGHMT